MKICIVCNKAFEKGKKNSWKYFLEVQKFCSIKCRNKSSSWKSSISKTLKGRPLSETTKQKMMGRTPWNKGKSGEYNLPKRKKRSELLTPKNKIIRRSAKYKAWRKKVFERDDYTCKSCWERGGVLNADHIKPFSKYPKLRFEISNGRTLCIDCHRNTPTYGNSKTK